MDLPRSPFAALRNFASLGNRGPLSPRKRPVGALLLCFTVLFPQSCSPPAVFFRVVLHHSKGGLILLLRCSQLSTQYGMLTSAS
jgi:hypothetical protein